jgi:signal transduction histidine kinase/CheY-like chemotaxis protein/HPt (histidine-containing phosphotransfer) domain-containing protein
MRFDVLDKIPVGILVLDPDYRIVFWNECLENWTGIQRSELVGADARSRFPDIGSSSFSRRIERVFRDGVPTVFSPQLHAPLIQCEITPGVFRVQYITVTSIPRPNAPGFLGVLSIQDITDLTRHLDESRRTAKELAKELNERMALQADLYRAKNEADAANRAKSEFLANMSHEIRTPMNGIVGMIGLLLSGELDSRQRRRAETLRSSAEDLLTILNDILDHSKIEARKLELEKTDFDLRAVVEGVADLVAVSAQKKGLEVLCHIEPNVPTQLNGDGNRLRQVLLNLAGNAVKFTHKGEVSISVRLDPAPGSTLVRFEVADTGIGISEDKAHLLFQPFSQADATTTRRYGGTGLGLSIVARLVEMMGGRVGFESSEGNGSRFWFTAGFEQHACDWQPRHALDGRRILVVDHNANARQMLVALLNFWHCRAEQASDVDTALNCLRSAEEPFHAALVDLEIDGGGGERLAGLMRPDTKLARVPLLVLVPLTKTENADHWRSHGFAGHLTKPVKQGELASSLADAMGWKPTEDSSGSSARDNSSARVSRAGMRLLLVEDNLTNQEVALGMLENLGYRADVASDGRGALSALAQDDYDLVLMDCQLPDLDGYEASRLIRSPATGLRNHEVPIIAMTACAMSGDREKCLAAGMNDYLSKPIDSASLRKTIEYWTARGGKNTPAAPAIPAAHNPQMAEFDSDDLLERLGGNETAARRVIGSFLSDMPRQLRALACAVEGADSETTRCTAHSIKGAAANVGGGRVREVASSLEQLGKAGTLETAPALLDQLLAAFDRLRPAMEEFCRS